MNLKELLLQPFDCLEICLREHAYDSNDPAELIRDVMGLANLPGDAPRYIVLGVVRDTEGQIEATGIDFNATVEIQSFAERVCQYLEPGLQIEATTETIDEKTVAVIKIDNCGNRPYMVCADLSHKLKTGACQIREQGQFRAARRADFDLMFGKAESSSPMPDDSEVVQLGFGDDPTQQKWHCKMPDVTAPPSFVAARRLQDQISVVKAAGERNVADSSVARLVHVQQYGAELPYDERGVSTLVEDYNSVSGQFVNEDEYYFYESNALKLNFCIRNAGLHLLEEISVVFTFPVVEEFSVVEQMCPEPGAERSRHESDLLGYPKVSFFNKGAQVQQKIDRLQPGEQCNLFESDLRVAVRPSIADKRIGLRYVLHARGLPTPVEGALKLTLKS